MCGMEGLPEPSNTASTAGLDTPQLGTSTASTGSISHPSEPASPGSPGGNKSDTSSGPTIVCRRRRRSRPSLTKDQVMKRREQNRKAQRTFRIRKDQRIQELDELLQKTTSQTEQLSEKYQLFQQQKEQLEETMASTPTVEQGQQHETDNDKQLLSPTMQFPGLCSFENSPLPPLASVGGTNDPWQTGYDLTDISIGGSDFYASAVRFLNSLGAGIPFQLRALYNRSEARDSKESSYT